MKDRTSSMAFSIEVRLPFLFHELAELVFRLPASYKIRDGWSKFLLRRSMESILPPAIAWRTDKVGFVTPQEEWLSHPRFQERISDAVSTLQREGWITEALPEKQWRYLFAARVLKNDL